MGKSKAHERGLNRARQKREEERAAARRQRLIRAVVAALVVLAVAVAGGMLLSGGEEAPVIDPAAEPPVDEDPAADLSGVACGGEAPPGAEEDKPQWDEPPQMQIDPQRTYRAVMETSCGTIELELYAGSAPTAVNSFVFLAREGFFDGVIFHRVVPGFVIQGGDPTGTGTGGPGYRFEDELERAEEEGYRPGSVAMANSGPDTNGSQFFIVLEGGAGQLQPLYTLFGEVVDGMDVAERIAQLQLMGQSPVQTVYIESVTIEESAAPVEGDDDQPDDADEGGATDQSTTDEGTADEDDTDGGDT